MIKQGVSKMLTIFLLLLYVATGVGVGIHHCNDNNTSYLFSSLVSSDCDDIHSEEQNNIVEIHSVACCVDDVLTLELAQRSTLNTDINTLDLPFFSVVSTIFNFSVVEECVQKKCLDTSISLFNLRQFLTVISVWII